MVSVLSDDMHLEHAVTATQSLFLRDLPTRVCVGPMPPGALLATGLPLKDLAKHQAFRGHRPGHPEIQHRHGQSQGNL